MFIVESNENKLLGKAFIIESNKNIELSKAFVVEEGINRLVWSGSPTSGKFFSARYDNALYESDDGIKWAKLINQPSTSSTEIPVTYSYIDSDIFVCCSQSGRSYVSTDLNTWTYVSTPATFRKIIKVGSIFYTYYINTRTYFFKSSDCISWGDSISNMIEISDFDYYNGKFYVVYSGGIYTSSDCITWDLVYSFGASSSNKLYNIAFGNDTIVVPRNANGTLVVMYSKDNGSTWNQSTISSDYSYSSSGIIMFVYNKFIMRVNKGSNTLLLSSIDGISWTVLFYPTTAYYYKMAFNTNNRLLLTDNYGTKIAYTDDGVNFTQTTSELEITYRDVWGDR